MSRRAAANAESRHSRRRIFDNGITRSRALAWLAWFACAMGLAGLAWASRPISAVAKAEVLGALVLAGRLLLVRRRPVKIPVLNYHSVSARPAWLQIGHRVSIHPDAFEQQLTWLQREGYRTLLMSELHDLLTGRAPTDSATRVVALTFDDGYLDNWVAAFPLLQKYGMKATLFVSTDFIETGERCRPQRHAGAEHDDTLTWTGYLNWAELRAMVASGLVDVQSHGAHHTRVFARSNLRGFVAPGRANLWVFWNRRPEARLRWWTELDRDASLWGHPVFPQSPGLAAAAYWPDPGVVDHLLAWTGTQGADLFNRSDWEQHLRAEWVRLLAADGGGGVMERNSDYARRVEDELRSAKRLLEEQLGRPVSFLCWPENAFTDVGEKVAHATGHVATISNRHDCTNTPGRRPERIVRVFIGSHAAGVAHPWLDFLGFVLEVKVFSGLYIWYPVLATMHAAKKVAFAVRKRSSCHKDFLSAWD